MKHRVQEDYARGYRRLTCMYCLQGKGTYSAATLVRQPYMGEGRWHELSEAFYQTHSTPTVENPLRIVVVDLSGNGFVVWQETSEHKWIPARALAMNKAEAERVVRGLQSTGSYKDVINHVDFYGKLPEGL